MRSAGQHRRLLDTAGSLGAEGVGLPGVRLAAREDTPTRSALDTALHCESVIFTSPSAVRFAMRLRTVRPPEPRLHPVPRAFALGAATAAGLRRAGFTDVILPDRADSESLLALPGLRSLQGQRVGLVTAPGGRGLIAAGLRERGARLEVAEVYERRPARVGPRHIRCLLAAAGRGAAFVTSAEAMGNVLAVLPGPARAKLLACMAVASSARLQAIARDAGFVATLRAPSPAPRDLLAALAAHASGQGFR